MRQIWEPKASRIKLVMQVLGGGGGGEMIDLRFGTQSLSSISLASSNAPQVLFQGRKSTPKCLGLSSAHIIRVAFPGWAPGKFAIPQFGTHNLFMPQIQTHMHLTPAIPYPPSGVTLARFRICHWFPEYRAVVENDPVSDD